MEKSIKITPPEGYEIDREKSTFEEVVFKKVEKKLPLAWGDLPFINGFYVNHRSEVQGAFKDNPTMLMNANVFPKKEQAEASIALAQLAQLREVWREGWVPSILVGAFSIDRGSEGSLYVTPSNSRFLSFKHKAMALAFRDAHLALIEKASPLLFG